MSAAGSRTLYKHVRMFDGADSRGKDSPVGPLSPPAKSSGRTPTRLGEVHQQVARLSIAYGTMELALAIRQVIPRKRFVLRRMFTGPAWSSPACLAARRSCRAFESRWRRSRSRRPYEGTATGNRNRRLRSDDGRAAGSGLLRSGERWGGPLPVEEVDPEDLRPRGAIETTRVFAHGASLARS